MKFIRRVLPCLFLAALTALTLDLANPHFDKPARDGGFFLYAGQQILDGKLPYRDFWDSKGPGIFYVNALGVGLGGGSRWGLWAVEFLCLFAMFWILYKALAKRWGEGAALFGAALGGWGLRATLGYGNYTEEYALLFNAAGLALFLSALDEKKTAWKYFGVGACFALSFSFRANNIGGLFAILGAAFLFDLFKRNFADAIKNALITLTGFAAPLLLWTLYFALRGAAHEMFYAAILFNFSYAAAQEREWLDLFGGFGKYGMGWVGWLTLAAWLLVVFRVLSNFAQRKATRLDAFLLIWFPIEILLSNLSGRNFTHYYASWIPAVIFYCALAFADLWRWAFHVPAREGWTGAMTVAASLTLLVVFFLVAPSAWTRYAQTIRSGGGEYADPVADYVREHSQPEDALLTWYPEMGVNFMSRRVSPVKYLYYPLFLGASLTTDIEESYFADLTRRPPELILDCARSVDAIPSLDLATREEQFSTPGLKRKMYIHPRMNDIFDFVEARYALETTLDSCLIFRLKK
ncbi:MAG: glycosyltransferase family 39 protein [Anaerolineales bacterium]|nr:glycosyltransferase family 39 protein [Anaerolineales bacterium]